ncbi:MAG: helix-turn-helix domain-containing protein [Desulfoferrobacter sp.]
MPFLFGEYENMVVNGEQLFSPKQVSERTGFSTQTLANWRSLKKGPKYKKIGRLIKYPATEVFDWLEKFDTIETKCAI